MPCCNHIIGTVLTNVTNKRARTVQGRKYTSFYEYYDRVPELFNIIDQVRALVKSVKQGNLQVQLKKTEKQEKFMRLKSTLQSMISVEEALDKLVLILTRRG